MNSKPLWKSKTFWSDVITIGVAMVQLSDCYFHTHIMDNPMYAHALWLAGLLGIYGRASADTKISNVI
jgi:hypothetical protein